MSVETNQAVETNHAMKFTGNIGLIATIVLAIILAIHPFGTTELYDDGARFLDHVNPFWITIHILAVIILLVYPIVIAEWSQALGTVQARVIGRWASLLSTLGMAIGALHLVGTDTMTFVFFEDTFRAGGGSEAVVTSADLLLRLHAATLFTWIVTFWFAVPSLLAVSVLLDGRLPKWFAGLAGLSAAFQVAALSVTVGQGQWTTLSETVLFRTGATLLIVFFFLQSISMRTGSVEKIDIRQLSRAS